MKKVAKLMLCMIMACCCFSICSCGGAGSGTPPTDGPTTESGTPPTDGGGTGSGEESGAPEKDENGGNWTDEMPLN